MKSLLLSGGFFQYDRKERSLFPAGTEIALAEPFGDSKYHRRLVIPVFLPAVGGFQQSHGKGTGVQISSGQQSGTKPIVVHAVTDTVADQEEGVPNSQGEPGQGWGLCRSHGSCGERSAGNAVNLTVSAQIGGCGTQLVQSALAGEQIDGQQINGGVSAACFTP
jgi:hypothetical protein